MVKNTKGIFLPALGTFMVLFALVAAILYVAKIPDRTRHLDYNTQSSTPAAKVHVPIDLTGIWESDNPEARFVATVTDKTIDIDLQGPTGNLAYWSGSFSRPTSPIAKIQSFPDPDKFTWSNATTKEFTYLDGTLAFDYSAKGVAAGIVLYRR